eukprot:14395746-Ditylum_brightwellii.AAC.1
MKTLHVLEEIAVCKLCSSKQNKNILGNTVDEYLRQIEWSLGSCIPQNLCGNFKKRNNCGTATSLRMSCKIVMAALLMQKYQTTGNGGAEVETFWDFWTCLEPEHLQVM